MPESIESFIKKLQAEGVDAGKEAAEKIMKEAEQAAEEIIADAKNEAEKIVAKAKEDAEWKLSHARTQLELAIRDTILKLRESLSDILSALLTQRAEEKLSEADYLGDILHEVIVAYARADADKQTPIEINVSKKMRDKLNEDVLHDLLKNLKGDTDTMGLRATLSKAGFEYKIQGATVEVNADSVSELLSEMVTPALQEVIEKAAGKRNETPPQQKQGEKPDSDSEGL
jgi:V/A-type H+-transporting ATPase subunit E